MLEEQAWYKQLREYKKDLESQGYVVVYIGLYGSQNYNLHDEKSDIDARAVVLPSIKQLLSNGTVSKVIECTKGQVDVKDVMTFIKTLSKGNPAYVECATTDVWIGDKQFRQLIQDYKWNPKAVVGMMHEKLKAIEKGLPKSCPMIETIGYDPKQYHHILRLEKLLQGQMVYDGIERIHMLGTKRNGWRSLEETTEMAKIITKHCAEEYDMTFEAKPIGDDIYSYVESKMIEQLFKPNATFSALQTRTFGGNVPKSHKEMFSELEDKDGQDITYCIYAYLEMLS